ncbi:hypothetical protein ACSNOB_03220 [Micromonospora sp. URMC 106]
MHLPDFCADREMRPAYHDLSAGEDLARLELAAAARHGVGARQH